MKLYVYENMWHENITQPIMIQFGVHFISIFVRISKPNAIISKPHLHYLEVTSVILELTIKYIEPSNDNEGHYSK